MALAGSTLSLSLSHCLATTGEALHKLCVTHRKSWPSSFIAGVSLNERVRVDFPLKRLTFGSKEGDSLMVHYTGQENFFHENYSPSDPIHLTKMDILVFQMT
jgi:hypothetical protein